MKEIGSVIGLFSAHNGQSGLPRPKREKLKLIKDFGIENDKFAGNELDRVVMIVGLKSYEIAKDNSIDLEYGSYGENILFDFDPHEYKLGTKFYIGDVVLEVTQKCSLCNHLGVFGKELPKIIKDFRGLYCRIIRSGDVTNNLNVKVKND